MGSGSVQHIHIQVWGAGLQYQTRPMDKCGAVFFLSWTIPLTASPQYHADPHDKRLVHLAASLFLQFR